MLKRPIFVQSNICKKYRIRKLWIHFKTDESFWPIIEQFLLSETNDENENIELRNILYVEKDNKSTIPCSYKSIEDDLKNIFEYCLNHPLLYEYMINDKKLNYIKNEKFKEIVTKNQEEIFSHLSANQNNRAIEYLKKFPKKINWSNLCENNCDEAIKIIETEFKKVKEIFEKTNDLKSFEYKYISQFNFGNIDVNTLASNTHPKAIKIIEYFYENSKDKKLDDMFDSDGENINHSDSIKDSSNADDDDYYKDTIEEKNARNKKMILRELLYEANSNLLGNPMAKDIIEHHIQNRRLADDAEESLFNNPCVSTKHMKIAGKIRGFVPQHMIQENPSLELIELLFTKPEHNNNNDYISYSEDENIYLDDKYKTKGEYKWVNWRHFLYNKSERAYEIISRNLHRYEDQKEFSYPILFNNPYLFPITEKLLNKSIEQNDEEEIKNILWRIVDNPRAMHIIYSWDYNKMRDENKLFTEELASYVFHPERLQKLSEKYGI